MVFIHEAMLKKHPKLAGCILTCGNATKIHCALIEEFSAYHASDYRRQINNVIKPIDVVRQSEIQFFLTRKNCAIIRE